jgi:hypothetical protein
VGCDVAEKIGPQVLRRTDVQRIRVNVTKVHLGRGECRNARYCPVACALLDALPGARVTVFGTSIEINGRPYPAPPTVRRFVRDFDQRGVLPDAPALGAFRFELVIEDGVLVVPGALVGAEVPDEEEVTQEIEQEAEEVAA